MKIEAEALKIAALMNWLQRQIVQAEKRYSVSTSQEEKLRAHHEARAYRNTRDFWTSMVVEKVPTEVITPRGNILHVAPISGEDEDNGGGPDSAN